jgi:hypothetical protein
MLRFSNEWLRDKIASDPDVECEAGPSLERKPMSYSFSVTASSKDEAGKKVDAELANVVNGQPTHKHDRQAAQDAAEAFINVLREPAEVKLSASPCPVR